ncbi:MAG: hypothetical protein M3N68_06560 [Actinomycetota bacterium]|nr:hypothetical protein [Actinomycetota bacterium]
MRSALADELEAFVARGDLWSSEELATLIHRLRSEAEDLGDPNASLLAAALDTLVTPVAEGTLSSRTAHELEAVVYPRMWKVMEAARGGLPDGEVRTRVAALHRRLSELLARERPG